MFVVPGVNPDLVVAPDSVDFGIVALGRTDSSKTVLLKNIGGSALTITNITSSNPAFSPAVTNRTIASLDTFRLRLRFSSAAPAGVKLGTLSFTSNDPTPPTVRMRGVAQGQADISVAPDTFSFSRQNGVDTTRATFRIRNTGTDTLRYAINEGLTAMMDVPPPSAETMRPIQLSKGQEDPRPGYTSPFGQGGPDAFGYRWIDSDEPGGPTFSWVDISATGTALDTNSAWVPTGTLNRPNDEGYFPVRLPFSFSFYGVNKDTIFIGTNGNIMFERPTGDVFTNNPFPTSTDPVNNHFGIFWDDLEVRAGAKVYYGTNAGNFVVQYQGMARFAGTVQNYTFEVIMSPSGTLKYQYLALGINGGIVNSATAGLENTGATIGLTVAHNSATYFHNNLAVQISSDLLPWASVSRTSGTIAPADSQSVELRIHPTGLANGVYTGRYTITGNTPTIARVGVRLQITGSVASISVTSPNGGELWNIGSTYPITWNASSVDTVTIGYSTTGRTGTYTTITSGVPARPGTWTHPKALALGIGGNTTDQLNGIFSWTIPNTPSTNCFVRIVRKSSGTPGDTSDAAFTIRTAPVVNDTDWVAQRVGSTAPAFYTVKAVSNLIAWAAGSGGTVVRTTDGGTTWTSVGGGALGTADVYAIEARDANNAWCTTSPSATNIYRTTNGGTLWTQVYTLAGGFIDGIIMTSATNGYAVGDPVPNPGGNWTLLRTTDGGATWTALTPVLPQVSTEAGWNNSFQIIGNTMWFGTNLSKVYRSTNLGSAWTSSATPSLNSYSLWFNNATTGMLGGAAGAVNKSTDGGATWTAATAAGTGSVLGVAGISGNEFWAASGTNVYYSANLGTSWTSAAKNGYTGAVALNAMSFVAGPAGSTWGWAAGGDVTVPNSAIVRYRRIITGVAANTAEVPTVYALDQNFPNPFNPTTTIRFALPEQANVSLKVYNVLGQEIATLVNDQLPAAFHNIVWAGKNGSGAQVASGLYFYRIQTGTFMQTRKMLLIR
jgi:photosystem II stability/assembly factor-like uncharacterized protein